jgi:hypothetical protein
MVWGHLDGGQLAPQVDLVQALVFRFLLPDVVTNDRLISAYRRPVISSRPEMLPDKISLLLSVHSRQVNRAFALDEPHHLRHRVFGWNGDHHVHMIWQQMPFFDPTLFLHGQFTKDLAQVLPQFPLQCLAPALRDKHHMVFALPLRMA